MNCEKQAIVFRNSFLIDYNFKGSMLHKSIHLFVRDVPVHTSVHKNLINKRIKDIINVICITFVEQKHFFVPKLNFFFIYRCFSTIIYIFASVIHLLRIDVRLQIAGNPL